MVGRLNLPWDVKYTRGGRLLITERTSKRLLTWRQGTLREVELPVLDGVGQWRDRTHVAGDRPRVHLEPSLLHLPGRHDDRRRTRRQSDGLAPQRRCNRGDPDPDPAHRASLHQRAARRLPAADRQQRLVAGRHRGCGDGDQPAGPDLAGRQDLAPRPDHRRALAEQPLHLLEQRQLPLRAHLRAPQRPGAGAARGRNPVVGRARNRPR